MEFLQPDTCYHIFNHANGFENVFRNDGNFSFFLEKYRKHISPIAETYAYCLMPNHFHLVVRIRKREVLEQVVNFSKVSNTKNSRTNFPVAIPEDSSAVENFGKVSTSEIEKFLSKQFANLFSSYTQSFNKVYHRMGSLFIKNFKRQPIEDRTQFLNTVIYVHRNPIHHGFCRYYDEWKFSSYNEIVNDNNNLVNTTALLKMFGGLDSLKNAHAVSLKNFEQAFNLEIP